VEGVLCPVYPLAAEGAPVFREDLGAVKCFALIFESLDGDHEKSTSFARRAKSDRAHNPESYGPPENFSMTVDVHNLAARQAKQSGPADFVLWVCHQIALTRTCSGRHDWALRLEP